MMITVRRILSVMGLVGMAASPCTGWSHDQANDRHKVAASEKPQEHSDTNIKLSSLVYPSYYEWVTKGNALAWVRKPDGSVVAVPLTGENRDEKPISGASAKDFRNARAYGLKMSPDGSKILFLEGFAGSPAGGWRVGSLGGTSYTRGNLLFF